MNALEEWCFWNIICSFISLLTYGFILVSMELERKKSNGNNVNPKLEVKSIHGQKRNVMLEAFCFLITLGVFFMFIIVYVNYSVFNH